MRVMFRHRRAKHEVLRLSSFEVRSLLATPSETFPFSVIITRFFYIA